MCVYVVVLEDGGDASRRRDVVGCKNMNKCHDTYIYICLYMFICGYIDIQMCVYICVYTCSGP